MYEYADQGDLEQRLAQDNPDSPPLTWKDRFSISYGAQSSSLLPPPLLLTQGSCGL